MSLKLCIWPALALALLATPDLAAAQVDPGTGGRTLDGGADIGRMIYDSVAETLEIRWASAAAAWPADFEIDTAASSAGTSYVETFENPGFSGSASSYDISACQYQLESSGKVIGWLYVYAGGLTWYGDASYIGTNGHFAVSGITFAANSAGGYRTVEKISVSEL